MFSIQPGPGKIGLRGLAFDLSIGVVAYETMSTRMQENAASSLRGRLPVVFGVAGILFGIASILSAGPLVLRSQLPPGVVPFVLWFNFCAAFVYIAVGTGLLAGKRWAWAGAVLLAGLTAIAGFGFAIAAVFGTAVLARTGAALGLRFFFWASAACFCRRPRDASF